MFAVCQCLRCPSNISQGLGEYTVEASVPSPVINVLCASMNINDLAPMVYTNWTSFNGTLPNATNWYVYATISRVLKIPYQRGCMGIRFSSHTQKQTH